MKSSGVILAEDGKACYDHACKCGGKLECKRCDKKFVSWKLLGSHYTTVHPNMRCEKCNKIFLLRYELMEHMKTHKYDLKYGSGMLYGQLLNIIF